MSELGNLRLGGSNNKLAEEQVQFISGESNHRPSIRPSVHLENLNNIAKGDSVMTNLNLNHSNTGLANNGLLKKKPNNVGEVSPGQAFKRPGISLTHLPKRPPVEISFQDLSYCIPEGRRLGGCRGYKTILKNVQGIFRCGELTAIMGPSGAGKSTLMNVLAGYKVSNLTGSVLINGRQRDLRKFRKMSCYIMQDDRLMPHLTVSEVMLVSANLKLGKNTKMDEKKILIEEICDNLGLSEAKNTQTQDLSGGQKKRLSIALEMVNNPPVMFFDEPTSGLDSSSCFQCLKLLKSLSRGGRTIICTIHQPSARLFEMFDHLYILTEGQCIYRGSVQGLVPYLGSLNLFCPSFHNPADYVMEVACGEHGEYLDKLVLAVNNNECAKYQTGSMLAAAHDDIAKDAEIPPRDHVLKTATLEGCSGSETKSPTQQPGTACTTVINVPVVSCTTSLLDSDDSLKQKIGYPTSSWIQFWILLKRTFLSQFRNNTLTRIRLISHFVVGLLIGIIYYDIGNDANAVLSNSGCIFFSVLFIMFTGLMPTILTFPVEMAVFAREHLNFWYSLKAYYLARTLADLPFQIAYSTAYVTIVYFMSGQPLEAYRFFLYLNICVLTSLVAESIGLLIGAAFCVEIGTFIGPISSIPALLFSGFFTRLNDIPNCLQFLTYISFVRYGFEGAMIAIYGFKRPRMHCSVAYCHYRDPDYFLKFMSMDQSVYWHDALALLGILVFMRIVAYFALRVKLHTLR